MTRRRTFLAFAVAPIMATAVMWVWLASSIGAPNLAFTISVLCYAYAAVVFLGIPAYLMTASLNLHAPYGHGVIGTLVGVLPAGLLSLLTSHVSFIIGIIVASAAAGIVFGLIAGQESNNRSRGP